MYADTILKNEFKDYVFYYSNEDKDKLTSIDIRVNTPLVELYVVSKNKCDIARPECDGIRRGNS